MWARLKKKRHQMQAAKKLRNKFNNLRTNLRNKQRKIVLVFPIVKAVTEKGDFIMEKTPIQWQ